MPKAQWSTKANEIQSSVSGGTFVVAIPLYDNNVKQGRLVIEMTDNRELVFTWDAEPGAEGLSDFRAWSTA